MQKNVSGQKIGCQMTALDGSNFTGSVTVYITGDNGTQSIGTVGSGACTHKGNGYHSYAPSQAETNYDHIAFTFIGSGAITSTVQLYTSVDANTTKLAGQTVSASGTVTFPGTVASTTNITAATGIDVTKLNGTSIAGTGTRVADSFVAMLNVAAPVFTVASVNQTGDAYARIGASGVGLTAVTLASTGLSNVVAWSVAISGNITGNLSGSVGSVTSRVTANMDQINGTSIAGTGTQVADSFVTMLNVASPVFTVASVNQTGDSYARIGSNGAGLTALASAANLATLTTYVDTEVAAIKAKTDNLPASPAATGDAMTLTSAYDAAKTAATQASVDTLTTYVDTEVAAIKAKTDNLPTDPADASDIASSFSTVNSTLSTIAGYIDTEVAAIKAKTDQITFTNTNKVDASLQAVGDVVDAVATKLAAIILRMTMANVEAHASGDALNVSSLYGAIQMAQEWSSSGVTITIRKTDGTSLGTKTATTAASGDVITGLT